MKIFLVLSEFPNPHGEAVEVVAFEVLRHLVAVGHKVILQVIWRYSVDELEKDEQKNFIEYIDSYKLEICPILSTVDNRRNIFHRVNRFATRRLVSNIFPKHLFPATRFGSQIQERVVQTQADIILSIWSWEGLAATHDISIVPKFMYYGNPDHKPDRARLKHPDIFGIPKKTLWDKLKLRYSKFLNSRREFAHIRMMNQCELTANNSVLDAQFYTENGHPRSIYLQNMWPVIEMSRNILPQVSQIEDVIKIIGSIGNLGATGNTFGLYYLGKEILPKLSKRLQGQDFEIHLLGKGTPSRNVAPYLADERIKHRGWVDDINEEFLSSHAFLILTNTNKDFLVGNTRLLLAWALGTCVVLHTNSALAMPEIEHEKNALLGNTPDEIVDCIVRAATDEKLRYQVGKGGYETFMQYYRSDVVMPKMIDELENCVRSFREKASR